MDTSEGSEKVPSRPVKEFEDLLVMVGTNGKKNFFILIMAACAGLQMGMHAITYGFVGATPDYWCKNEVLSFHTNWTQEQIRNITSPTELVHGEETHSPCTMYNISYSKLAEMTYDDALNKVTEWAASEDNITVVPCSRTFADHPETIVTKWDLVCERRYFYTFIPSADSLGALIGALCIGYLSDRFGRKRIYHYCVGVHILCLILLIFSPSIEFYIFIRVINAVGLVGFYMVFFVLVMEFCLAKDRTLAGTYFVIPWSIGRITNPGIAYVVRQWQQLYLILSFPVIILVLNFWVVPESPRWLIMNGHHEKAYKELKNIADSNKRNLPGKTEILNHMEYIQRSNKEGTSTEGFSLKRSMKNIFILLINRKLRFRTILVFYCWFAVALVYFGVTLDAPGITKSVYLYMFFGGMMELASYLILFPVVHFLGRRISLVIYFALAALSISVACAFLLTVDKDDFYEVKLIFYLMGKFAISSAFQMVWMWTAEMYPTKYRNHAVGQSSAMARIGSMFSPFINDFLSEIKIWIPSATFGCFAFLAIVVSFILKDTSNQSLKEFVGEEKEEGRDIYESDSENERKKRGDFVAHTKL